MQRQVCNKRGDKTQTANMKFLREVKFVGLQEQTKLKKYKTLNTETVSGKDGSIKRNNEYYVKVKKGCRKDL
jgi:hypothetical protein